MHTVLLVYILTARMAFPSVDSAVTGGEPLAPPEISAQKTVNFDLLSDHSAPLGSWARVVVPKTLSAQGFVEMGIISKDLSVDQKASSQTFETKHVTRSYWGSSESPTDGQPLVVTETPDDQVSKGDLPSGTYAYWPAFDNEELPKQPRAIGAYSLKTSYCGSASFSIGPSQEFLEAIEMIGLPKNADLDKAIPLKWKKIPGALGYVVSAFAGKGNETVEWTAGNDLKFAVEAETRAYTPEAVQKLIESGALLGPDTLSATIPAGIFKNSSNVMLAVHALGRDQVRQKKDIETRLIVRSSAAIPIYVKQNATKWGTPDTN